MMMHFILYLLDLLGWYYVVGWIESGWANRYDFTHLCQITIQLHSSVAEANVLVTSHVLWLRPYSPLEKILLFNMLLQLLCPFIVTLFGSVVWCKHGLTFSNTVKWVKDLGKKPYLWWWQSSLEVSDRLKDHIKEFFFFFLLHLLLGLAFIVKCDTFERAIGEKVRGTEALLPTPGHTQQVSPPVSPSSPLSADWPGSCLGAFLQSRGRWQWNWTPLRAGNVEWVQPLLWLPKKL